MEATVSQRCVCLLFSLDHFSFLSGYCRCLELDDNWTRNTDRPNSFQLVWMVCRSKTELDHAHHRFCDIRIRLDSYHFPNIPPLTHVLFLLRHDDMFVRSIILWSTFIPLISPLSALTAFPSYYTWLTLSRMQQVLLVPRAWVSSTITQSLAHNPQLFPGFSIPFRVHLPIIWKTNVWCLRAGWWQLRKLEFRPTWNSYLSPLIKLLAGLAIILGIPFPVWIYYRGEAIRAKSDLSRWSRWGNWVYSSMQYWRHLIYRCSGPEKN